MNQGVPAGETVNADLERVRRFVAGEIPPGPIDTSPLLGALGAELVSFDASRREFVLRYAPAVLFRQGAGVIQGGAVVSMLDFAMAFAAMAVGEEGRSITTTTMNTSFYAPAASRIYEARGRITKQGRRLIFTEAELSGEGRAVAAASSSLLVI